MDSNKKFIAGLQSELKNIQESLKGLENKIRFTERKIWETKKWTGFDAKSITYLFITGFILGLYLLIFSEDEDFRTAGFVLTFGCGMLSIVFGYPRNKALKAEKALKSKLSKFKNELQNRNKKIEDIKAKLNTKRDNTLQSLIAELKSELDLNSDDTIDVIQHENEFYNLLKSNQSIILEMEKSENRDFTKQFVKLSNFLVEKEKNLQSIFKRISDIKEYENFDAFKSNLIDQIQFYNILRLNSLQMISSFIDDDRITFYMIYEKLDKLGVWNTNFENQFLFKMDLLNSNINRLISEIKDMSQSINNSISELIFITQENTDSVTNKLKQIGSKLDTSNLLSTINTYQNYKTNQSLK